MVQLSTLIEDDSLIGKPFMIVLNKSDLSKVGSTSTVEISKRRLGIQELVNKWQGISVVVASPVSGEGVSEIILWLRSIES